MDMKVLYILSLLLLQSTARPRSIEESEQARDSLIAEVESMGYVIESAGKIVQREDREACGLIRLGFEGWLTDADFKSMAEILLDDLDITHQDLTLSIARLACEFKRDSKEIFDFLTAGFGRFSGSESTVLLNVSLPWIFRLKNYPEWVRYPSTLNVTKREKTAKMSGYARDTLRERSKILLAELKDTISDISNNRSFFEGREDTFFEGIEKSLMFASNALTHGIRTNKVASITNKGRDGDSIVAEVCVDYTSGERALDGFRIVPIGYVKDGIYIHPHLSSFYALPEGKNGVDDLLVPGDFVCRDKRITVVETLDAQDPHCSLTSDDCPRLHRPLRDYDDIIKVTIDKKMIIVTSKEYAMCFQNHNSPFFYNKNEEWKMEMEKEMFEYNTTAIFRVESPIMVHNSLLSCEINMGNAVVANHASTTTPIPNSIPIPKLEGAFSEQDSNKTISEKRWNFVHEIGYPIVFVVFLLIIMVLILILLCVLCKLKRDSAETDYQLFD